MQEAAKKIEAAVPDAFDGDGHALLVAIYKDPSHPIQLRLDAAKAAIRYERPRLAATEFSLAVSELRHTRNGLVSWSSPGTSSLR
jgi:hypothetical protein